MSDFKFAMVDAEEQQIQVFIFILQSDLGDFSVLSTVDGILEKIELVCVYILLFFA